MIVDARVPEGAPGTLYEVPGAVLDAAPPHGFTLHDFRWDHAIHAGRAMRGAFPTLIKVFLIEAADLSLRLGLTPAVAAAAETAAARVEELAAAATVGAWA